MMKWILSLNRKKVIACIVGLALLILLIGACAGVNSLLNGIGRLEEIDKPDHLETLPGQMFGDDVVIDQADKILSGKNVVNILLVGQDRREEDGERMHSDAMILCTINTSKKTLTMTSFMRDMWVYVPGYHNARLNVPYMYGGFELLNDTLEYNFGVRADYNVEIDFSGFMTAIDLVGGVEIELTAAEAKYLNEHGNWGVGDESNWSLKKGINLLSGSQALAYSRIRQIGDDFARTNRQRNVLNTLIDKMSVQKPTDLYETVKQILPLLATDMTNSQIIGLMIDIFPMLSEMKIISQRIPLDGQYSFANKYGASVIVLSPKNFEENKKLLIEAMSD